MQLIWPRRFYLAGDMTNLYSFIQSSLEWPFSELFFFDVSLWNRYKYIAFNIFSCRILIISYKMLIITRFSNETRIICSIISKRHNIFPTTTSFFISSTEKIENVQEFKVKFFEYVFTDDCMYGYMWQFSPNMIFRIFETLPIYYNIIQWKYLKTALIFSIAQIKQAQSFHKLLE